MRIDDLSPSELEAVLRSKHPQGWADRREQYLGAPSDPVERREWMNRRNAAIQDGVAPVNGIDFGRGDRKGR